MRHTIICWDCSFRNFFHTINSIVHQDFDKNEYELIFVEQRDKKTADVFNHAMGLKSLGDIYEEVKKEINIQIFYLEDELIIPYHLGRCVNKALENANGEFISVMDGDMLLPQNFLKKLDEAHHNDERILNLERKMVPFPVGVDEENWVNAEIDFSKCLEASPDRNKPIPKTVSNKGPMISARKQYWKKIKGYDQHIIWSTGLSRLGQDVTKRLEILLHKESECLSDVFAIHPYHPFGFDRNVAYSKFILGLQKDLIQWAENNNQFLWEKRINFTENIYQFYLDNYKYFLETEELNFLNGVVVDKFIELLHHIKPQDKIIIFGAGEFGKSLLKMISSISFYKNWNVEVDGFVDNDPHKWNSKINNIKIFNPSELNYSKYDKIVIATTKRNEIKQQLMSFGSKNEQII